MKSLVIPLQTSQLDSSDSPIKDSKNQKIIEIPICELSQDKFYLTDPKKYKEFLEALLANEESKVHQTPKQNHTNSPQKVSNHFNSIKKLTNSTFPNFKPFQANTINFVGFHLDKLQLLILEEKHLYIIFRKLLKQAEKHPELHSEYTEACRLLKQHCRELHQFCTENSENVRIANFIKIGMKFEQIQKMNLLDIETIIYKEKIIEREVLKRLAA